MCVYYLFKLLLFFYYLLCFNISLNLISVSILQLLNKLLEVKNITYNLIYFLVKLYNLFYKFYFN